MPRAWSKKAGYFQSSRTLAFGLIAILPLLAGYQYLAFAASKEQVLQVRNGADVILRQLFAVVGIHSPFYLGTLLVAAIGAAIIMRRKGTRLEPRYFLFAILESVLYALLFTWLLTEATDRLMLAMGARRSFHADLMLALGAGVYEELLFRVVLYGGAALILLRFTPMHPVIITIVAALVSSLLFAWAHYMGWEQFNWYSFVYRLLAGLLFCLLYQFRGLGIAAWAHALYDIFLIV